MSYDECACKASEYRARVACFVVYGQQPSASSQNMEGAVETARRLKEISPETFILFVGGHLAALPRETLQIENSIDAVCQNEGVYTIRALLELNKFDDNNLLKIDGLCFRDKDGDIHTTSRRNLYREKTWIGICPALHGICYLA